MPWLKVTSRGGFSAQGNDGSKIVGNNPNVGISL